MPDTTMTAAATGSIPALAPRRRAASTRLRIAHVTATFPPYWAGTGNVAYHNARELARRGHAVTVFTAASPGGDLDPVLGVEVRRLPALLRLGNAPILPRLLGVGGFDVVHLHYPFIFGAELIWAAAKIRRFPYVLTYHNDLIGDGWRRYAFDAYSAAWARPVFAGARKIVVVSLDHAFSCRQAPIFRDRQPDVLAVPNGVDSTVFRPGLDGDAIRRQHRIPPDAGLILFVGALDRAHHFKGVPHLLATFSSIRERDAILMLVGDGDLREAFTRMAHEYGVLDRVRFAGSVPHAGLPSYYAASDVVVLPSFPPESFGLVLIEAMACGRPVVAHDIPGVRAVVDDGVDGFLVRPGDAADLAEKVSILLADPNLRTRLGIAGRRKVERRYDWRVIGERLEQLYLEVVGDARRAPETGPTPTATEMSARERG